MASNELLEIIQRADQLSPSEQLQLISHLVERTKQTHAPTQRTKWRDVRGAAPPLLGKDAQEWVSSTRRESDEHRSEFMQELP